MEHNQISFTVGSFPLPTVSKEIVVSEYFEGLSFKKYLAKKDRISSTGLKQIISMSPYAFKENWVKNLEDATEEEKDHFRVGTAVHLFFLEPEKFRQRFVLSRKFGTGKVQKQLKQEWLASLDEDAIILTQKEMDMLFQMAKSIKQNCQIYDIITRGIPESTILFQDDKTGILCKARPDLFVMEENGYIDVFDIKTARSIYHDNFKWDAGKLKYHQQVKFYADAVQAHFKKEIRLVSLIVISKEFPCEVAIKTLNDYELEKGADLNRAALDILKQCIDINYWPQRQVHATMLDLPKKFLEEQIPQYDFTNPYRVEEEI